MRYALASLLPAALLSAPLAAQPAGPVVPPLAVAQIPGVTVNYYDVSGSTPQKILAAMRSRPAGASGKAQPVAVRWSVGTDIQKSTTGGECRVLLAKAMFRAEVAFPRLVVTPRTKDDKQEQDDREERLAPFLERWQDHVAKLDQQLVAYLRPLLDQIPEVERAAVTSSCDGARAATERVIARMRQSAPSS